MTIEEYCSKLNVTKEALSDKQIEEWGLKYCQGYPFDQIYFIGTGKDKRNAIGVMRRVINEGGNFVYSYMLDEDCVEPSSVIDLDIPDKSENVSGQKSRFKIWIEN